jgi:hypothetical protein
VQLLATIVVNVCFTVMFKLCLFYLQYCCVLLNKKKHGMIDFQLMNQREFLEKFPCKRARYFSCLYGCPLALKQTTDQDGISVVTTQPSLPMRGDAMCGMHAAYVRTGAVVRAAE